jgi:serine/threonine protein kinase/tetratricopeptide (TPR) repeat protein
MARNWRCANGHAWVGEIGALTFCPECNSRDVYEIRTGGEEPSLVPPTDGAEETFSKPHRAHEAPNGGANRSAPPPATSAPVIAKPTDQSQLSTKELHVAPADQSTVMIAPATANNAGSTQQAVPSPTGPGDTLVCRLEGSPGDGQSTVCRPESDLPAYVASSTSDSTLDLPSTAKRDSDRTWAESPKPAGSSTADYIDPSDLGERTLDLSEIAAQQAETKPAIERESKESVATAVTVPDPDALPPVNDANRSGSAVLPGRRSSGETADTKAQAGRAGVPHDKRVSAKIPEVAGYEILAVLGRGGMGVVYKARQIGLNRLVALKMILGGGHAAATDRGRFETEALAVAKLQHTNIVQVFEVGECDGLPFFSLEYLDGGSLQDKLDGKPLPPRVAAAVVEQLARAMQYAHANGIVHRDLKPANILLKVHDNAEAVTQSLSEHSSLTGPRPVQLPYTPKITDFGLAKDLKTDSGLTGTGAIMGTPSFMSPEQAEGKTKEIGPPTDIHALGAILYDALAGRPPFLGADPMATIMQVRMMEPVPPSRWQPGLPRDLETVCLKCLEKSPARRYPTAGDLADDLHRFLDGEPVHARPTSWLEKGWKWAKRRPTAAALIALSALVLVGSTVAAAAFAQWQHQRAEMEHELRTDAETARNLARVKERLANQESDRANANYHAARDAMDAFLTRVGDERLRLEPRTERLQAQLLDSALKFYDRFLKTEDGAEPAVRREAGWAYQRAGRVREMLGKRTEAIAAYREAVRLFAALAAQEQVNPLDLKGLADSYRQLTIALEADNQRAAADEAYAKAKEVLDQLVAAAPRLPIYRIELASLLNNRGTQLANRRKPMEAISAYRDALRVLSRGGNSKEVRFETAKTNANLGTMLLTANQIAQGRDALRASADQFGRLAKTEDDPQYAHELGRAIANLGTAYMLSQQPDEAIKVYRDAGAIFVQLVSKFPRVPNYRFELAKTYDNVGEALQATKGRPAAEPEREKAREIYRDLVARHPDFDEYRLRTALSLDLHGVFLAETGKRDDAIAAIRDAVSLLQKLAADDPYDPDVQRHLGQRLVNLGILLAQEGQNAEAESTNARAIAVLSGAIQRWPALDSARKSLIDARSNQAHLMRHLGRSAEEEAAWTHVAALQAKRAADFPDRPDPSADLARTHYTLAGLRSEKPALALAELRDAFISQKNAFALAPQRADLVANLGLYGTSLVEALTNAGDHAAAAEAAERVVADLPQNWTGLPKIAGFLAQCLRVALDDKELSEAERASAVKQYGAAALNVLRRAVAGGFKDAAALQAMRELAPLRESAEFKAEFAKLIDEMRK